MSHKDQRDDLKEALRKRDEQVSEYSAVSQGNIIDRYINVDHLPGDSDRRLYCLNIRHAGSPSQNYSHCWFSKGSTCNRLGGEGTREGSLVPWSWTLENLCEGARSWARWCQICRWGLGSERCIAICRHMHVYRSCIGALLSPDHDVQWL